MKKLLVIFLFLFSLVLCNAQIKTNSLADTLNSRIDIIEKNLDNGLMNLSETGNPFKASKDSISKFDSLHGKITLIIKDLKNTLGNLNVALYNSYKGFANHSIPFRAASVSITDFTMIIPFDSVPPGIYSLAAFHDEDKDGKLKTNQLNIPIEGYCFSNNIGSSMGPPDYNKIKFIYSGKNRNMVLNMTYLKFPK
jgi:uncharacterized protein (DUF2141 family)